MALILQMQRRAIEALCEFAKPGWRPDVFNDRDVLFSTQDETLELLGISEGIGTCSDIHGMNVAVLGHLPITQNYWERKTFHWRDPNTNWDRLARCTYAVLLWRGAKPVPILETVETKSKHTVYRVDVSDRTARATVELLHFSSFKKHRFQTKKRTDNFTDVFLSRTGLLAPYVQLI